MSHSAAGRISRELKSAKVHRLSRKEATISETYSVRVYSNWDFLRLQIIIGDYPDLKLIDYPLKRRAHGHQNPAVDRLQP